MLDKITPFSKKVFFSVFTTVSLLLFIELCLQIGVHVKLIPYYSPLDNFYYSYNSAPYFSKACCKVDSISGFRWIDNGAITLKVCRGEVVFKQLIKPNNAGFISPSEFEPKKKDTTVFRWLVFGDSFTDGYFLRQNWPSRLDSAFRSDQRRIEIHSFALNGSGIKTWARVLDWLDKTNYQYDGVIIACFGNDLSRDDFIMYHSGPYCYYGWGNLNKPTSLARERLILEAGSIESANQLLSGNNASPKFQLLLPYYSKILFKEGEQLFVLRSQYRQLFEKYISSENDPKIISRESLAIKYGTEKMAIVENMLSSCSQKKKKVILATIPEKMGLTIYKQEKDIQLNLEMRWLATENNMTFFDGYRSLMSNQKAGEMFLRHDGHWNQFGSDCFANHISSVIIAESIPKTKRFKNTDPQRAQ